MQDLLGKGLLTAEEAGEAVRLLEEAERGGGALPLAEALLRAGLTQAHEAYRAAAALDQGQPVGAADEAADPLARASGLQVIERIGRGTQAIVYKCRQVDMDRIVAVKFLQATQARDEKLCQRFVQEARSAAKLSHPNIVTIHEIRPYKDTFYIVMEYVDGGTVDDLLVARKRIGVTQAIAIVRGVARGLAHAHSRGIIHRDIKPRNIMLTKEGVPKLADLGLARYINDAGEEDGKAYGTPYYISPEQVTGDPPADFRTDLYSLGITFYQMVTGRPPFIAATPQEIMRLHVLARLPDPREFAPDLPQALSWLLAKACAREPEDRYESAEDFVAALDELERVQALPEAIDSQDAPAVQGRQWPRASVLSEAPPVPARPNGRAATGAGKAGPAAPATDKRRSAAERRFWLTVGGAALVIIAVGAGAAYYVPRMLAPPAPPSPVTPSAVEPAIVTPGGSTGLADPSPPVPPGSTKATSTPKPADPPAARKSDDDPETIEANAREALQAAKDYEARKKDTSLLELAAAYQNVIHVYPKSKAAEEAQKAVERLIGIAEAGPPAPAEPVSLDGDSALLKASAAALHGSQIRYEQAADRDSIGFWHEESAWVSWDVKLTRPGTFAVEVTYAAEAGCNGNEYTLALGDQQLPGKVSATGGWGAFKTQALGTLKLTQAGDLQVVVKPKGPIKAALMNLQAVILKRIKE